MSNQPDLWDPQSRVSFPNPLKTATATVEYGHDGVRFAKAIDDDFATAYYVSGDMAWNAWSRIAKADHEAAIAHCKADRRASCTSCGRTSAT